MTLQIPNVMPKREMPIVAISVRWCFLSMPCLQKGDQVKAVLLTTITGKDHSIENAELFQQELNSINAAIGAHIEYERLTTDFYPSPTGEYFIASVKHEKQSKRLLYYKKK